LSNSALILYTTKTTVCAKNLRNAPCSPIQTIEQSCCHVSNEKKGADAGIAGIAYFKVGKKDNAKLTFRPNQGGVSRKDIATLGGDMRRTEPPLGVLITIVTAQEIVERHKRLEIPMGIEVLKAAQRSPDSEQLSLL
jgi:hypothetical protein